MQHPVPERASSRMRTTWACSLLREEWRKCQLHPPRKCWSGGNVEGSEGQYPSLLLAVLRMGRVSSTSGDPRELDVLGGCAGPRTSRSGRQGTPDDADRDAGARGGVVMTMDHRDEVRRASCIRRGRRRRYGRFQKQRMLA